MMQYQSPTGIWLPIITPFKNGRIDESSLRNLVRHYASQNISGIILAATTGEGQMLSDEELHFLSIIISDELSRIKIDLPVYMGFASSDPIKVCAKLEAMRDWPIDGYLVTSPLYLRPSQVGIIEYFRQVAGATLQPIILYNIPYRTGVNMENETLLELAKIPNVVGVKDCSGNSEQSRKLLREAPLGFSVLTGEDGFFYEAVSNGGPGAILTGAHVIADVHYKTLDAISIGEMGVAIDLWNSVSHVTELLFAEPSPAPVKYWLWKMGLIESPEVRLPFLEIGQDLKSRIDKSIEKSW